MDDFTHVKEGDTVKRMLAGIVPMQLKVTKVDDALIYCGVVVEQDDEKVIGGEPWMFDRNTGAEYDPDLGWGIQFGITGSYLVPNDE